MRPRITGPAILALSPAALTLASSAVSGTETTFRSPGGAVERCIALRATPGGHYSDADRTLEREANRREWLARKPALRFVDDAGYPFRYAFAAGEVLFVSLDVTRVGAIDADEKRWLDQLLGREAARFRHRVVFSHLPVYPFTHGRETEVSADHELERILRRHGVELYLSGHHHAFYPGYREGIRFVSQACLGAGPRALLGTGTPGARAITLLEIEDDGPLTVRALAAPDFSREIDRSALPRGIASRYGTMIRDDLAPPADAGGTPRVQ